VFNERDGFECERPILESSRRRVHKYRQDGTSRRTLGMSRLISSDKSPRIKRSRVLRPRIVTTAFVKCPNDFFSLIAQQRIHGGWRLASFRVPSHDTDREDRDITQVIACTFEIYNKKTAASREGRKPRHSAMRFSTRNQGCIMDGTESNVAMLTI